MLWSFSIKRHFIWWSNREKQINKPDTFQQFNNVPWLLSMRSIFPSLSHKNKNRTKRIASHYENENTNKQRDNRLCKAGKKYKAKSKKKIWNKLYSWRKGEEILMQKLEKQNLIYYGNGHHSGDWLANELS